ncbi:MAG: cbb3-type cytochrome c oxidase subunit II, partial [Terracidiphilus sp.]
MSHARQGSAGWQGACLVAITYVYFLIFAQFAFLTRLANLGVTNVHLKIVMAAMAAGGILLSLLAPRLDYWPSPTLRLRAGFCASGFAAFLAPLRLNFAAATAVSFLIGAGLGLLTVTLVTHLHRFTGDRNPLLAVGAGTGTGYFICNLPPFFTASATVQIFSAGVLCLAGIGITFLPPPAMQQNRIVSNKPSVPLYRVLAGFTALVWLDSAAFFIIQNTPALKAGTWQGTVHLWTNGVLHFAAALACVWFLRRKGLSAVLVAAFLALGTACLFLLSPGRDILASIFYPIGVSLYSVALVAYPSLLSPAASTAERGRMAGWIYAIAGWAGSAMGIGMGQNLGHIPPLFVAVAGATVLLPQLQTLARRRGRELALTGFVLIAAFRGDQILIALRPSLQLTQIERGRHVYISEGCIYCHSQYVRPNSSDVLMWGPVESIQQIRQQQPPLIGNRRQGPDLSNVGARRSALWLKAHFYHPAEVSGASIMPTYGFLFSDQRGSDLVAYLDSLHGTGTEQHLDKEKQWQPSAASLAQANANEGERLYRRNCSTCHNTDGATRHAWQSSFQH